MTPEKVLEITLKGNNYKKFKTVSNIQLIKVGQSFFNRHCGQKMGKYRVFYNDRCTTHKVQWWRIFIICECPDCNYFDDYNR